MSNFKSEIRALGRDGELLGILSNSGQRFFVFVEPIVNANRGPLVNVIKNFFEFRCRVALIDYADSFVV